MYVSNMYRCVLINDNYSSLEESCYLKACHFLFGSSGELLEPIFNTEISLSIQ